MSGVRDKLSRIAIIVIFFFVCLYAASSVDISNAPDEEMRYQLAQFIFENGYLPEGSESSIINPIWGFSYAFLPFLTSIISAGFMKAAALFGAAEAALLTAARLTSVLSGTGTLIFAFLIGDEIFKNKKYSAFLACAIGFLPQFVFISCYQNNDSFAVFTSAVIIYFWILGIKKGWTFGRCIGLGIGCGLCAMSYYNAYVYILASVFLFFISMHSEKRKTSDMVKGGAVVLIVALAIGGWFFVRAAILHNGDFLGFSSLDALAEQYAMEGFKPSDIATPSGLGMSFADTFLRSNGFQQTSWLPTVAGSFIGAFANMTVKLPMILYGAYFGALLLGILGAIFTAISALKKKTAENIGVFTAFICVIVGNVLLFMLYVYFSDYQAQGRYLMPSIIPLMIFITYGYKGVIEKITSRRQGKEIVFRQRAATMIVALLLFIWLVMFVYSYNFVMLPGCRA